MDQARISERGTVEKDEDVESRERDRIVHLTMENEREIERDARFCERTERKTDRQAGREEEKEREIERSVERGLSHTFSALSGRSPANARRSRQPRLICARLRSLTGRTPADRITARTD